MQRTASRLYNLYFNLDRLPTSNLNSREKQMKREEYFNTRGTHSLSGRESSDGRRSKKSSTRDTLIRLMGLALGFLLLRCIAVSTFTPSIFAADSAKLKLETRNSVSKGLNISIDAPRSRCYWSAPEEISGLRASELDYLPLDDLPLVLPKSPRKLYLECFSTEEDMSTISLSFEPSGIIEALSVRAEPHCLVDNCEAMKAELEILGNSKECDGKRASSERVGRLDLVIRRKGGTFELEHEGLGDGTALISPGEWSIL